MATDYSKMSVAELNALSAQNSADWHGADAATQAALHDANVAIKAELDSRNGTQSTYNSQTGAWTTTPSSSQSSNPASRSYNRDNQSVYDMGRSAAEAYKQAAYQTENPAPSQNNNVPAGVSAESAAAMAEDRYNGVGAYQTTYRDSRGNEYTGYIINDKTYTDPYGYREIPVGSYVTDSQGRVWYKGEGNNNTLVSSPLPEDHYDYMTGVQNTKEYEYTTPEGYKGYATYNPDKGETILWDSKHNSIGRIDSAGRLISATPESEYDQAVFNAVKSVMQADGVQFNGSGIIKIANGQDQNMERAYLINQYADALDRGEDGADILKALGYTGQATPGVKRNNDGTTSLMMNGQELERSQSAIGSLSQQARDAYGNNYVDRLESNYGRANGDYQINDFTPAINDIYDAQFNTVRTQIENQLAQGEMTIDQALEKIPAIYEAGRNDMANQYEINKRSMNEYFAANGLSSGARAQALLAANNVYQSNMAAYRLEEANKTQEYEDQRAQLRLEAQSKITEALLQNETKRAADILAEFNRQDEQRFKLYLQSLEDDYRYYALNIETQLKQMQLQQDAEQFAANYNLNLAKLQEEMRQYDSTYDLNLAKLEEDARQANLSYEAKTGGRSGSGNGGNNSGLTNTDSVLLKEADSRLENFYYDNYSAVGDLYNRMMNYYESVEESEVPGIGTPAAVSSEILQPFLKAHSGEVASMDEVYKLLEMYDKSTLKDRLYQPSNTYTTNPEKYGYIQD